MGGRFIIMNAMLPLRHNGLQLNWVTECICFKCILLYCTYTVLKDKGLSQLKCIVIWAKLNIWSMGCCNIYQVFYYSKYQYIIWSASNGLWWQTDMYLYFNCEVSVLMTLLISIHNSVYSVMAQNKVLGLIVTGTKARTSWKRVLF